MARANRRMLCLYIYANTHASIYVCIYTKEHNDVK